jgi:hypothetical protein
MTVFVAALAVATARAENPRPLTSVKAGSASPLVCRIYALADLSDDAQFGVWIAKTIPEVIEPKSWTTEDASGIRVLTYNAAAKIMVVYQTPSVHEAIVGFLKNVKQALPALERASSKSSGVAQASHTVAAPAKFADPAPLASVSPVRTMADRPPHLFHIIVEGLEGKGTTYKLKNFTLRYEGDGIIDANIVDLIRAQAAIAARQRWTCPDRDAPEPMSDGADAPAGFQQLLGMLPFRAYTEIQLPRTNTPTANSRMPQSTYIVPSSTSMPLPSTPAFGDVSANANGFARAYAIAPADSTTLPSAAAAGLVPVESLPMSFRDLIETPRPRASVAAPPYLVPVP